MLRGNRGFIVAVIGCLIAALALYVVLKPAEPRLPRYQQSQAGKSHYHPGGSRCEPTVLAKLPIAKAARERDACEEAAEQHRLNGDDLIQQTRAADAASEGVVLNYTQTILALTGVIFGLFTLVAAAAAAWFAKRAADAAHNSLMQSRHESRAWVSLSVEPIRIARVGESLRFFYRVNAENKGGIVATNINLIHMIVHRTENIGDTIAETVSRWESRRESRAAVILPGETQSASAWDFCKRSAFGLGDEAGIIDAVVLVYAMYNVGAENEPRYTRRTFKLSTFCDPNNVFDFGGSDAVRPFIRESDLPIEQPSLFAESHASAAN